MRRDSSTYQSRGSLSGQGSQSGSTFNLQLDIMDDIADAKAKAKEKRKTSWAPGPALDESPETHKSAPRRRASELPSLAFSPAGIVCTNTDLVKILSPVKSTASEISPGAEKELPNITVNPNTSSPTQQKSLLDKKRRLLKDRSNSFDIGALTSSISTNWFTRRQQPIVEKKEEQKEVLVTFTDDKPTASIVPSTSSQRPKSPEGNRVVWDDRSGSVVDANILGSAIEVFLNRRSSGAESQKGSPTKVSKVLKMPWLTPAKEDPERPETCQTSICSTLKDLFVK